MCGFKMKNTASENGSVSRGLCTTNAEGNLVDVVEHTKIVKENGKYISNLEDGSRVEIPGDAIVSMNMWGFQDTLFDYLEELFTEFLKEKGTELKSEFYIPFVVDSLVKAGRCTTKVLVSESAWFGVTYPEDKPLVQSSLQKLIGENIYPEKLFS